MTAKSSALPVSKDHYFRDSKLEMDGIAHGFFGRQGGVSKDIYASLNCGAGSDDDPGNVLQNRARVAASLGVERDYLLSLHQIHSAECITVDQPWGNADKPQADGFVTDKPGIALGILTADCAPVLFAGQKADGSSVIGAAHAGWGGAFKGVLGATVDGMVALGAQKESICAVIGPCIAQASYEVGPEFVERFIEQDEGHERFFKSSTKPEHMMFDLAGYVAMRLAETGVKTVGIKDIDTYYHEADFFSYRRATHRKNADYGRQISAIVIKES